MLESGWIRDELSDILLVFCSIASLAGQGKVGYAIGSTFGASHDMIDFQGNVLSIAVGAPASPLLKQILAHFETGKRPLLVLHAGDLGILQSLGIKK